LTTPLKLRPALPVLPVNRGEIGPRPKATATSTRLSRPSRRRKTRPLTLLSPAAIPRFSPGLSRRPRTASTALRQQERLSRPRSAFHRQVRRPHSQAPPATDPAALPPRSGFRRSFAPPMLSHERARSSSITRVINPGSRGPRAACRLLQSKRSLSTTARSIEPRSPRPGSPPSAAPSTLPRPLAQPRTACRTGGIYAPFEAKACREVSGQGQELGIYKKSRRPLQPSRSLTMVAYPQPDRLPDTFCRKPASTQVWRTLRRKALVLLTRASTSPPGNPAFAGLP